MIEGLPGEVKEFQVFFPDSTTEVITKRRQQHIVSVLTTLCSLERKVSQYQYLDTNNGMITGALFGILFKLEVKEDDVQERVIFELNLNIITITT